MTNTTTTPLTAAEQQQTKMNPKVKELWLARLRDPEAKQCTGQLQTSMGYCCLGLLSDEYVKAFPDMAVWKDLGTPLVEGRTGETTRRLYFKPGYGNVNQVLSTEVRSWADLSNSNPCIEMTPKLMEYIQANNLKVKSGYFKNGDGALIPLSALNDGGVPFSIIADLIEEQL